MLCLTVDGNPFVEVLPLGQHDRQAEVARAQSGCRMPHQVVLVGAFWDVLLWLEGLIRPTSTVTSQQQSYIK